MQNKLKALGLADSTIRTYSFVIGKFLKYSQNKPITEQLINEYLDNLIIIKNYSARSRNHSAKILRFYCRTFHNFELEIKKAKENKPIPKICEDYEFSQIISVTKNIKHKLCLMLMRYSGLRRWEVIRVMRHHIKDDGRLFVKDGKGAKDRYTIIPPQVKELLNAYLKTLPAEQQYIFSGQNNKFYSKRTPQAILINAFRQLAWHKERWFGCHALRHAFAIWCIDDLGLDFDLVSKMLGHSVKQTTQIYTQCRKLNLQKAIQLCGESSLMQQTCFIP